jgi:inorganic pyrophosphatase/exopolyphosphatase
VNKEKSEGREKKKKQGADTFFFLQTWTIKSAQHLMKKIKKSSRKKNISEVK